MLDETAITCPYCGEPQSVLIDPSEGEASYIEDCRICCQPIRIEVYTDAHGLPNAVNVTAEQA